MIEITTCYYYAEKGFLEHLADTCLIPFRYLLKGKTIVLIKQTVKSATVAERTFWGCLAAIIGFAISIITGAFFYSVIVKLCSSKMVVKFSDSSELERWNRMHKILKRMGP